VNGAELIAIWEERVHIVHALGWDRVCAISGGHLVPIEGGIEMPVSRGYRVRVVLTGADDHTVTRVFRRNG